MRFVELEAFFGGLVRDDRIRDVLSSFGVRERRRGGKLPPQLVVWLLIVMALHRRSSIRQAVARLAALIGEPATWRGKAPHPTSIAEARDRVGWEPLRELLRTLPRDGIDDRWQNRTLIGLDGVCFRAPDSAENRVSLGKATTSKRTASWPQLRAVLAVGLRSHFVYDAAFGPYKKRSPKERVGETALAESLLKRLPEDSLLVADRGYCYPGFLAELSGHRLDFVVRAPKSRPGFRARRVERLPDGSDLVEVAHKGDLPLSLRRLRFRVTVRRKEPRKKKGKRHEQRKRVSRKTVTLLTTLVDWRRYPPRDLAELYRDRWETEHAFKEIKCQLLETEVAFRSRTLTRVLQEAYAALIAYCCLRGAMSAACKRSKTLQLRLSFADALDLLRAVLPTLPWAPDPRQNFLEWLAREAVLPERRKGRHYPREKLARNSRYPIRRLAKRRAA